VGSILEDTAWAESWPLWPVWKVSSYICSIHIALQLSLTIISGKSSLILTLARLLELHSGTIHIDGVNLSTLPRQQIRSSLSTLPQDALKFSGTVRRNLDPQSLIRADEPLTAALRKTAIWPAIEARGGLDADMEELGFSAGQLQLFCLTRVLLDRSAIVLLDEVTSSVDRQTDEEIRRVIGEEMKGRTVVEVAHRMDIVHNYDVVVVLSEGRVQEVGNPEDLLARPSAFRTLWESSGL
jgi:ATP-binding cassette subfamily C (CFTR/MRP) protein 1